jgi:hypothetical protein
MRKGRSSTFRTRFGGKRWRPVLRFARDVFVNGSAETVVIDVRNADAPYLKVSISLRVDDGAGTEP